MKKKQKLTRILLLSDIHGNYPALEAIAGSYPPSSFDAVFNCGDSTVYAPFPNETINWLQKNKVYSIRGNTDDKIIRLLKKKSFKKPRKKEKRIMYTTTAEALDETNQTYLLGLKKNLSLTINKISIGLFHGSPADHDEFLFATTPDSRFQELSANCPFELIVTGHSHSPYHKTVNQVHFINPGSAGRMFDGNPQASFAILELHDQKNKISVQHHRLSYDVEAVVKKIRQLGLPDIYSEMYKQGKKLN